MLPLSAQPGSLGAPPQDGRYVGADGVGGANRTPPVDASLAPLTDMQRGLRAVIPSRCLNCLNRLMRWPTSPLKNVIDKTHLGRLTLPSVCLISLDQANVLP